MFFTFRINWLAGILLALSPLMLYADTDNANVSITNTQDLTLQNNQIVAKELAQEELDEDELDNLPQDAAKLLPNPLEFNELASLFLLNTKVPQGVATRLSWSPQRTVESLSTSTPVLVVNGAEPGMKICLTGAIHGDELNGIEIIRRVLYTLDPQRLKGTVIGVPIVNLQGFQRNSRYMPDRRDLNRYFPGNPEGSLTSRTAYSLFNELIIHCDALIDLHTGSFHRTNLTQLRADLSNPKVRQLAKHFDSLVVLHSEGGKGTLRRAAMDAGVPAVTLEAGEPMRLQEKNVKLGVSSIFNLLDNLGVYKKNSIWRYTPKPIYLRSVWVRSNQGGILLSDVALGAKVQKDDVLGTVIDPITNVADEVISTHDGLLIGMALNQVVMPGYAAYHLGIEADVNQALPASPQSPPGDPSGDDIKPGNGNFVEPNELDEPANLVDELLDE
jgi:hypothetical protein